MNDQGLSAGFVFVLENGSPLTVTQLPPTSFYLHLQDIAIAKVSAYQLTLKDGLQTLSLQVDVDFIAQV